MSSTSWGYGSGVGRGRGLRGRDQGNPSRPISNTSSRLTANVPTPKDIVEDYDFNPDTVDSDPAILSFERLSLNSRKFKQQLSQPKQQAPTANCTNNGATNSSAGIKQTDDKKPIKPLTTFFEFASKDPPVIPTDFMPIGTWNNDMPTTEPSPAAEVLVSTTADHDDWGNGETSKSKPVSTFEVDDEKQYVEEYKLAMEAKIKNASNKPMSREDLYKTRPVRPTKYSLMEQEDNEFDDVTDDGSYVYAESLCGTVPPVEQYYGDGNYDEIWDQYDMDTNRYGRDTQQLAVYHVKSKIMSALAANQVTIVEGFTGCGKTTQIPQFILQEHCRTKTWCNIVVTQPRRLAAVSVATRVCDEKGWQVGSIVGYQVGLSKNTTSATRLTYVTTGILLQSLISRKTLSEYTHIIIDEVHERDLETDLLLLIIKKMLVDYNDRKTKIILMSATLNTQKFADYFPQWLTAQYQLKAAIVQIPLETIYPVHVFYLDEFLGANYTMDDSGEPRVQEPCYKMAADFITRLEDKEESEPDWTGDRGGVLIFLPGFLEIETMCQHLAETARTRASEAIATRTRQPEQWMVLPLHSTITSEEQARVFQRVPPRHRKIVVATNIAESSITVSDMRYVIDFCLTKSLGYDSLTNYTCLRMEWASQDQCTQRKGRVGRVAPGLVFRLVTRSFWFSLMKETVPDMEKSSLENVVLKVKNLNMGSPKSLLALAIDPPKLSLIGRAVAHLKEVGALTINTGRIYDQNDGDLTPMGNIMSKLPLDVKLSRLIALGYVFGVLEETIIIAAGLSGKSPFSYPFNNRLGSFMSKLTWANETFSDCFAVLCLYRTWRYKWQCILFHEFRDEKMWARNYYVQLNMMREIHGQVEDIAKRLNKLGMNVNHAMLESEDMMTADRGLLLKIAIAGAFYPNYFVRTKKIEKEYEKSIIKDLLGYNPMYTMYLSGYPTEQPAQLYMEAIGKHFSSHSLMPTVEIAGGKVLIHFDSRGDRIGRMSVGIYKGLKMRYIKQLVSFKTISCIEAHELLENALCSSVTQFLPCPPQVALPRIDESHIMVHVTHVELPDLFYVTYDTKWAIICDMNKVLNTEAKHLTPLKPEEIHVGGLCVVEFKGYYFRGRIDYKQNKNILVYLIDRGNSVWRPNYKLLAFNQTLFDQSFDKIEVQAMQCRIYGIKQLPKFSGVWNDEAKSEFVTFAANQILCLEVYSIVDSVIACDLMKEKGKSETGVRQLLLDLKLATIMKENDPSSQNHNVRIYAAGYMGSEEEMKRQNQMQIKRPAQSFVPTFSPRLPRGCMSTETTLRGPFSPLEMEFTSVCRSAHLKTVKIENSSVNSIALDQEPFCSTTRLLVAGSVAISQRTGVIVARDTTLMPAVPGLVALLTMIFCPKLEMRVNFREGKYVGCLSGLGIDPGKKKAIYPDHDVEITFDAEFDDTDLNKINELRLLMNNILKGDSNVNPENMRKSARAKLSELIEKPRQPMDEFWIPTPHKWGLIPEDKLIHHAIPAIEEGFTFPSHCTVRMQLGPGEDYDFLGGEDDGDLDFEANFEY